MKIDSKCKTSIWDRRKMEDKAKIKSKVKTSRKFNGHDNLLKSQCHPKCFARRGTFFIYEKYAIVLIVVKSDLYLLPSLPLAIRKHYCEF